MNRILGIAGLLLLGTLVTAQAGPVDVSCTVSGSSGNWLVDCSVTDNLGGTNNLYLVGVKMPARDITASPVGWDPNFINGYNPSIYGGSNTEYNNMWLTSPSGSTLIHPGQTLGGFQTRSTAIAIPTSVPWMAVATGGTYLGSGCSFICGPPYSNVGFEGIAAPAVLGVSDAPTVGVEFALLGSNPLRGAAEFRFALPQAGRVAITVHDLAGRVVAILMDGEVPEGRRSVSWPLGASTPAGVYFARMWTTGQPRIQRLVVLK